MMTSAAKELGIVDSLLAWPEHLRGNCVFCFVCPHPTSNVLKEKLKERKKASKNTTMQQTYQAVSQFYYLVKGSGHKMHNSTV